MLRLMDYFEPPRKRRNCAREIANVFISEADTFSIRRRSRHFKITSANVNGLRSKLDIVRIHAELYDPDVILLQETKLHSSLKNSELQVPGYLLFRKDRTANGGGVCIYAREDLKPRAQFAISTDSIELLSAKIRLGQRTVIVASVYRPPARTQDKLLDFHELASDFLSTIDIKMTPLLMAGDMNLCWTQPESGQLKLITEAMGLKQIIDEPTHKKRTIDLLFMPQEIKLKNSEHLAPIEAFHDVITATLDLTREKLKPAKLEILDYKRANWAGIYEDLNPMELNQLIQHADSVDDAWSKWKNRFNATFVKNVPKKTVTLRKSTPWINNDIRRLSRAKDLVHRMAKIDPTSASISAFKTIRKKFKQEVRRAKTDYCLKAFTGSRDSYKFWQSYRKVTGQDSRTILPELEKGDRSAKTNEEKAALLRSFFKDVVLQVNPPRSKNISSGKTLEPLPRCNPQFVDKFIAQMPLRKAPGLDGITPRMLKATKELISLSIATLINRCLDEEAIPTDWKKSLVIPVPKVDNSTDPSDYRPISLLPIVSKIFERHVFDILYERVESKLSSKQFGFRKGRSTTDALLYFEHLVMSGFDECRRMKKKAEVLAVFFDVQKAFDTTPHAGILDRLASFAIPKNMINLIENYLQGRSSAVKVVDAISDEFTVSRGVPQGSILGPLLFIVFIDQVFETRLSEGAELVMYADDLAYVKPLTHAEDAEAAIQDLSTLEKTYRTMEMALNAKKTRSMVMSLKQPTTDFELTINGTTIERVNQLKYLGVNLDPKLSYVNHVYAISTKCKQAMGALSRATRKWIPKSTFEKIYKATIEPIASYASEVWYPSQVCLQNTTERIRKFAARLCANDFVSDYPALLTKLSWKSFGQQTTERRAIQGFKYAKGISAMPGDTITLQSTLDNRRSERNNRPYAILVPATTLDAHLSSSLNAIRRIWNNSPQALCLMNGLPEFKNAISTSSLFADLIAKNIVRSSYMNL